MTSSVNAGCLSDIPAACEDTYPDFNHFDCIRSHIDDYSWDEIVDSALDYIKKGADRDLEIANWLIIQPGLNAAQRKELLTSILTLIKPDSNPSNLEPVKFVFQHGDDKQKNQARVAALANQAHWATIGNIYESATFIYENSTGIFQQHALANLHKMALTNNCIPYDDLHQARVFVLVHDAHDLKTKSDHLKFFVQAEKRWHPSWSSDSIATSYLNDVDSSTHFNGDAYDLGLAYWNSMLIHWNDWGVYYFVACYDSDCGYPGGND